MGDTLNESDCAQYSRAAMSHFRAAGQIEQETTNRNMADFVASAANVLGCVFDRIVHVCDDLPQSFLTTDEH
jgi:hypothetical protein